MGRREGKGREGGEGGSSERVMSVSLSYSAPTGPKFGLGRTVGRAEGRKLEELCLSFRAGQPGGASPPNGETSPSSSSLFWP